jgi:ubiquinone/menaquinone biosynthesis C-methylase UbiE
MSEYIKGMQADARQAAEYFNASIVKKTEQQKILEKMLLAKKKFVPQTIADIACGGGGASVHLSELYPQASFTMIDANLDAITIAKQTAVNFNATCSVGDIYDLQLAMDSFDLVICWQTLSWLDRPEAALHELIRICKPGGIVLASSLFNIHHDVDIYSRVIDHTRPSSTLGINYNYNTYSLRTVNEWLGDLVANFKIHEFSIPMDLAHSGRGIGTYTVKLETGERLQMSAGMHLKWGILEVKK